MFKTINLCILLATSAIAADKKNTESGNDYVCDAGAIGNCDCGKAKTCVCTVGVGNCVAEDVTDKVTCTVGTGNCVVGSATETVCDVTTGNCESDSAKVSCTVQTGNCNGKKATTSFTCTTTAGNCAASGNTGGSVDCTVSAAGNCMCGDAKTCGGKVKAGNLSCMKAEKCDCSGVSTGTCCGVGEQITAKPTGTSAVVKDQACCGDCSASSASALTMSASAMFVAAVVFGASL